MAVAIKALACELPHEHGLPLSRLSVPEIRREAVQRGLVASIGATTVWRWLTEDAIRPWHPRSWLFPRDPDLEEKAARILDLYAGLWRGRRLSTDDCLLSAAEKTSIEACRRVHPTSPPAPGQPLRVEHEYERLGAWAYLAAWDVRRAKIHGRCEPKAGIAAFERLVDQVMSQEPYRSARRVFWIVDNGSSHRGQRWRPGRGGAFPRDGRIGRAHCGRPEDRFVTILDAKRRPASLPRLVWRTDLGARQTDGLARERDLFAAKRQSEEAVL